MRQNPTRNAARQIVLGGYAVSRRSKHWPGWFRAGRSNALTSSMMAWAGWSPTVASQAQTSARSWCEPGMLRRSSGTQGTMYRLRKRRGPMGLASGRERRSPLGNIVLIAGGSRCKLLLRTARSKAMFQIAGTSMELSILTAPARFGAFPIDLHVIQNLE
jgi:hypothetical protein